VDIDNALNSGIQGFQKAANRASQAAQDIASQQVSESSAQANLNNQASETGTNGPLNANASEPSKSLTTSLVELRVAENEAKANANVIRTASDIVGSLLDVTA
jgi:hypothetical protein